MTITPTTPTARRRPLPQRAALLLTHALLALPVTVVALVLAVTGNASTAGRLQRRLASLGGPTASASDTAFTAPDGFRTVAGRALRGLPAHALAFVLASPSVVLLLTRGLFYPVATAGEDVSHAWGGPTPAGAWAAHFAIALALVVAVAALLVTTRRPHRW